MPWDDPFYDDGGWNPGEVGYNDPDFGTIPEQPMPDFGQSPELDNSFLDDPFANWGGGAGGDGSQATDLGGGLGSLLSGSGNLGGLLKALGLTGKDGSIDLGGVLSLLALGGGALNQSNAVSNASEQMQEAANKANDLASAQIGGARGNFAPYVTAGHSALAGMEAFDKTPLAAKFKATGGGAPSALMDKFSAARSLGDVARIRR